MTIMIALIGEQQLPNFLPVLHYSPTHVLLVYTERTQPQYKNLKAVLEQKKVKVYGVKTDPYDISIIVGAINEELTQNEELAQAIEASSQLPMFNLTGGTKIMSLAAYQVAAQQSAPVIYQSERGQSIIDLYRWQDQQLCHKLQEELPDYLSLRDMLELHLGQKKDIAGKERWVVDEPTTSSDGGHLFELAIKQALREHGYEALCGVKNHTNQVDIDVMIRYKNQVGIIEAKTGKSTDLRGVKQLSYAIRYLGGTFTRQFLVLNCEPTPDQQMMCELLRIHIISLLRYQQYMVTLPQEDMDILLTEIGNKMKARTAMPNNEVEKI